MSRYSWLWLLLPALAAPAAGQVSEMSLDPLLTFVTCLRDAKPGYCLQERALGYFETWITHEDGEGVADTTEDGEEEPGSQLSPYWKKMVDQVAERIAGFYGEDDDKEVAEAGKGMTDSVSPDGQVMERKNTSIEGEYYYFF